MFFPKEMSEVELIVPSKDLVAVTKALSGYGVFHQVDSAYLGMEGLGPNAWHDKAGAYSALERRIQSIFQNVGLAEEYPAKAEIESVVDLDVVTPRVDQIEAEVKAISDRLSDERKRLELLESQLRQLEPIADVDVEVEALREPTFMHSILGIVPAANISRLRTSLLRVPHVFFILREDAQKPVVWILGSKKSSDILERAAKSAYLNSLSLPEEFGGTPEQITAMLRKEIESSKQKIANLEADLTKLGESHKVELKQLLWDAHISRVMADSIVRFGQLRHTYVVVGWVPTADLADLTSRLKEASREILIETTRTSRSGRHANVPVALAQNKWLKPIQMLVGTYGHPSYGELDPTLLMAFTFPLLYGAMFGDLGQGLVMMALGILMHNKIFLKGMHSLGLLIAYCGASAAVFGYLYGSIFGFEGHLIEEYLHFHFEPRWLSPMHDILSVLSIAIDAGIVILMLGFLLGMLNNHYRAPGGPDPARLRYVDLLARQAADSIERHQAEEALRQADRHKDEFLAMLSHELRKPLGALTTAAHVLRIAAPDDTRVAGVQRVVERQTRHMVRLIEDLLDITRVRLGKLTLRREPLELADLVA
ncbi:MAG: hypothetical protein HUU11_13805, partial [Anaerolineales bacterium]|nr:hypothetical protein [Anaerolineales bacterium]